jgi:hypothetical protein
MTRCRGRITKAREHEGSPSGTKTRWNPEDQSPSPCEATLTSSNHRRVVPFRVEPRRRQVTVRAAKVDRFGAKDRSGDQGGRLAEEKREAPLGAPRNQPRDGSAGLPQPPNSSVLEDYAGGVGTIPIIDGNGSTYWGTPMRPRVAAGGVWVCVLSRGDAVAKQEPRRLTFTLDQGWGAIRWLFPPLGKVLLEENPVTGQNLVIRRRLYSLGKGVPFDG